MKLLTKEILKKLPPLGATDGDDSAKPIVKFFNPVGSGTWLAFEYSPEERLFFGWAEILPGCGEFGYFSLDELENVTLPLGLKIERDLHFTPTKSKGELMA